MTPFFNFILSLYSEWEGEEWGVHQHWNKNTVIAQCLVVDEQGRRCGKEWSELLETT